MSGSSSDEDEIEISNMENRDHDDDEGDEDDDGDDDDDDEEEEEEEEEEKDEEVRRPKKKSKSTKTSDNNSLSNLPLEIAPSANNPDSFAGKTTKNPPIIVLLDLASLETVKNRRGNYELLNCDDHRDICRKKLHKDPNSFRPDILHQELLALLDSPLNKAGLLHVYISTTKHVLIDVHPSIRIPRTYKRFAGLMVQLLHKMKIKASNESTTLLKVIKNPFSQYLPPGTRCYGMSCEGTLYSPIALAKALLPLDPTQTNNNNNNNKNNNDAASMPPTCFVVGAMSTGHITINDHPYIEKMISISSYPLSGAAALSRMIGGIEHHWGIV